MINITKSFKVEAMLFQIRLSDILFKSFDEIVAALEMGPYWSRRKSRYISVNGPWRPLYSVSVTRPLQQMAAQGR